VHKLDVKTLFNENYDWMHLEIVNGKHSFEKPVSEGDLHRPGLALSGFVKVFTFQRIQVFGNTEMAYLGNLSAEKRSEALETVLQFEIPCIIISENNEVPSVFIEIANKNKITILRTRLSTTRLMHLLGEFLDQKFAPTITVHGSLVDVYGVGVLFTGRSGIGKSEIALDLVERGHRLVADDVVNISREAGGLLLGRGSELLQYHMEIRGLGIIDVKSLFGINSIRAQKRIEIEVNLAEWNNDEEYERVGLDEDHTEYLEVKLPTVQLPIFPGKNITVIAEVIALNLLLKLYGHNTAKIFSDRLLRKIQEKKQHLKRGRSKKHSPERGTNPELQRYLRRDYE